MDTKYNDANLSRRSGAEEPAGPTRQRHRMACGEKVNGQTNPNGGQASTENKVAGQSKTY